MKSNTDIFLNRKIKCYQDCIVKISKSLLIFKLKKKKYTRTSWGRGGQNKSQRSAGEGHWLSSPPLFMNGINPKDLFDALAPTRTPRLERATAGPRE